MMYGFLFKKIKLSKKKLAFLQVCVMVCDIYIKRLTIISAVWWAGFGCGIFSAKLLIHHMGANG